MGMLQLCGDRDYDAVGEAELRQEILLEGDHPVVLRVTREEDGGHSAAPDLSLDRIALPQP
jgi:hypothetical protein